MMKETLALTMAAVAAVAVAEADFHRMAFNNPYLVVPAKSTAGLSTGSLGVRDWNGDGLPDILLSGGWGKQWNGTQTVVFVNPGPKGETDPLFDPPKVICSGHKVETVQPLDRDGKPLKTPAHFRPNVRDVSRQLVDYDGDGVDDLVVSCGDWTLYGWDNGYDAQGMWTTSTLHGYVYWYKGLGGGRFGDRQVLRLADGNYLDAFGGCSALFADWDGDGDLDLIRIDFTDTITFFENIGTRREPVWEGGRFVRCSDGSRLTPELCMAKGVACDWNGDGRVDIVISEEDARPAVMYNTGRLERGIPVFDPPRHFRQRAGDLYLGVLNTPWAADWDGDGDLDFICGDSAGHVAFIENLSGKGVTEPKWAAPVFLKEPDGKEIRILAGVNGSIQGPCENKWGYTCLSVADWDGDGLPDVMANTIWGRILWWRNIGTRTAPKLDFAKGVEVEWDGPQPELKWGWFKPAKTANPREIVTQWRSTPVMADWDGDGLVDLLLADVEGNLGFWRRARKDGRLVLLPPVCALVNLDGSPIRLSGTWRGGVAGGSGRRKLCLCDWDGDGKTDLVMNSGPNAVVMRQERAEGGKWFFAAGKPVAALNISQHDPQPTAVDFDGDGRPELVMGAEDGYFYYLRRE